MDGKEKVTRMSIVSTARYSKQNHHNLTIGNRKRAISATDGELNEINKAIIQLNEAKRAVSDLQLEAKLTEAYRITRNVIRGRLDV